MNTKTIFKALALAMLMPATLLTTACSSEDDSINNNENTIKKGYELPVTINVTRQGDNAATRATYNESTHKLEFSTGDKLLVGGHHVTAGDFSGMLDYDSEGKFSGTITTNIFYNGTADNLLSTADHADATLLPAGYEDYHFLSLSTIWIQDYTKAFATSKATAIEQFSYETASNYSNGFTLSPGYAILNFTITGLTPSTKYDVNFTEQTSAITGTVKTDESGTATFAMAKIGNSDLAESALMVGGNAITLVSSSTLLTAGKIYNIARSALIVSPAVGQVIGNDGKNYAAGSLPDGVTAVAIITYVGSDNGEAAPYNHGLALALSDANGGDAFKWKTSNTDAGHTKQESDSFTTSESGLQYNATHNTDEYPAFQAAIANNGTAAPTGCSAWFLASGYQWVKMANAAGGYDKLGLKSGIYWSSSERDAVRAWFFGSASGAWDNDNKEDRVGIRVRACLAF